MVKDKVEVKACRRCKGLFETTSDVDVCPVCKEALNKVFREVKQFIRKKTQSQALQKYQKHVMYHQSRLFSGLEKNVCILLRNLK